MVQPDRQHDNIIRRMRFACWIIKTTNSHSEHVTLIAFPRNNGYANAPRYYVICTLPVLLITFTVLQEAQTAIEPNATP